MNRIYNYVTGAGTPTDPATDPATSDTPAAPAAPAAPEIHIDDDALDENSEDEGSATPTKKPSGLMLPPVIVPTRVRANKAIDPPWTTQPPSRRRKIAIEPGCSQLDWAELQEGMPPAKMQPITREELAQHKTKYDCWQAYGGKVYDVTPFLKFHPGGARELMRGAGKDATELAAQYHPWVNVHYMIRGCLIGYLVMD